MAFKLSFRGGNQASSGDGAVGGETVKIEPHVRAMIAGDGGVLPGDSFPAGGAVAVKQVWTEVKRITFRTQGPLVATSYRK